MIGDRNCIPFRAFLVFPYHRGVLTKQYNTITDNICPSLKGLSCMLRILSNCYFSWRTLKDVNNIFVSDFSFLTFLRYYHHIAQHYSQVQEYKVFVTTISADIFLSYMTHFFLPVLVLSLLRSILSREGTHGLPLRCTPKPTCTKPLTRYPSWTYSHSIFFKKIKDRN